MVGKLLGLVEVVVLRLVLVVILIGVDGRIVLDIEKDLNIELQQLHLEEILLRLNKREKQRDL